MRLKKLEIYGFKSFADRVEMSFESGITGVVGPNGSGKSNISDAVRWVLGEQSAKTLRGGKMEDIIFNGTEKRKKLAWCEVILTFDNTDHALPIDFSEVAVMRRVYRNGDSEYMLNKNTCRLRDIVELFRDTGIGKEGYSLIGQGRIDEILSVKSEERRQVFEEAAGIVKYKTRKSEAEKRLENTAANLARVQDIISELEGRLEPLRIQSAQAREYLQLREELKGLELNAFLLRSQRYETRLGELRTMINALNESVQQAQNRQNEDTRTREETQQNLYTLETKTAQAREQVQALIREVEMHEGEIGIFRERILSGEREQTRLTTLLADADANQSDAQNRLTDTQTRFSQEIAEAESAKIRLSDMEKELDTLSNQLAEREQYAESLKRRMIDAMNHLSDVKSEHSRLKAIENALLERLNALTGEHNSNDATLTRLTSNAQHAQQELSNAQHEKERSEGKLRQIQQTLTQASRNEDALTKQKNEVVSQIHSISSRMKVLEEMRRDYEGYQNSVKQVLLHARKFPQSGVLGVIANLIQVPHELERAMDMVLGASLQNIVVEREEDAKQMIDYLRINRLGRATFLPLTAVHGRTLSSAEREVLKLDGCVGLASELISFDKKYQGIVDSLLGRTVVAKDLDSGIRIQRAGHHAFRLVTLEGDVMHSGGSMTGGSVQSRMTSLLSREREINEHRTQINDLQNRVNELDSTLNEIEQQRTTLKQERNELFDAVREQDIACAREEARLHSAQEALNTHRARLTRAQMETERMRDQLADVQDALNQLSGQQQGEEQSEADQQAEILRVNEEIAQMRTELSQRQQNVMQERIAQATRERGVTAIQSDIRRILTEQKSLTQQKSNGMGALSTVQASLEHDRTQLQIAQKELNDSRTRLGEARKVFDEVDAQRTAAQHLLRQIAQSLDELRANLNDLTTRQHSAEMLHSRLETEFKQLTDHIWEDYELTYAGAEAFRIANFKLNDAERRVSAIRQRIRAMGTVHVGAVEEYRQTQARFEEMSAQRDDLNKAQLDLSAIITDLTKKMETQFRTQFDALNQNFQETFVKLFGGGKAELQLSNPKDVLNCNIEVVAQPPGKKLQMLSLLSGGERALTAIAILFAMLKLKPTPFCFLDEIEAALDDANIDNFADYLRTYSQNTQFVVVTHRKGTMERCNALYGVTMEEKGVSKMVSVKLSDALGM